jgi:DUF3102 family protein
MRSKSAKVALAKGAEAIRKAERERDGTLAGAVREITRLHGEILAAAKMSLEKAIKIGELLSRVRASRKGKWLAWIKNSVPFSDQTARNYIRVYERRDDPKFKNVLNLSDAYSLLCAPGKGQSATKALAAQGLDNVSKKELESVSSQPDDASESESGSLAGPPPAKPERRSKSVRSILREISPENIRRLLGQSQIEIDKELGETIAQVGRQDHAEWPEFPDRLATHGKALIAQSKRLTQGKPI